MSVNFLPATKVFKPKEGNNVSSESTDSTVKGVKINVNKALI